MNPPVLRHPLRAALALVLSLALSLVSGCFDPPVLEELRLDFGADGSVAVSSRVELSAGGKESNAAVERRLEELRAQLLAGDDPWAARFAALDAPAERFSWEKRLSELHSVWRSAYIVEPASLGRFFAGTDLHVSYEVDPAQSFAELILSPGAASRATRKQQKLVEEAFGPWSEAIAAYLARLRELYVYLDEHPERVEACFGELFSELLVEEERAALPAPNAEEDALLERLGDAMQPVWGILLIESGEDHSLDELSRLVYDPFPARLSLTLPERPSELEGAIIAETDGSFSIPEHGLWQALVALEGQWIAPDPLPTYVRHRGKSDGFSLAAFLAQTRTTPSESELPSAREVRAALEEGLEPDRLYRLRWPLDPNAEPKLPWEEPGS